jgi:hypothetical protein
LAENCGYHRTLTCQNVDNVRKLPTFEQAFSTGIWMKTHYFQISGSLYAAFPFHSHRKGCLMASPENI